MDAKEFNKRCNEVFLSDNNEYYYGIVIAEKGNPIIYVSEADGVVFDYEPDMTERPEALDYLLGRRNDFND